MQVQKFHAKAKHQFKVFMFLIHVKTGGDGAIMFNVGFFFLLQVDVSFASKI